MACLLPHFPERWIVPEAKTSATNWKHQQRATKFMHLCSENPLESPPRGVSSFEDLPIFSDQPTIYCSYFVVKHLLLREERLGIVEKSHRFDAAGKKTTCTAELPGRSGVTCDGSLRHVPLTMYGCEHVAAIGR